MSGNPTTPLKSGSERVAIGNGLPTVPKSLVEKIQKWEYVDLADLLPAQSLHDQMTNSRARFTLFPGCELVRSKRRQIEPITEWVKALSVFMVVVAMKEPALVLAYQLTIIKAAQSYDGLQCRGLTTLILGWRRRRSAIGPGLNSMWTFTPGFSPGEQRW